jgi:hypothetical protein
VSFTNRVVISVLLVLGLCCGSPAGAQNYRFRVEEMKLEVFVQTDASARLKYEITFRNEPSAHPIDIVDVGLPHGRYNTGNMAAKIDGRQVSGICKSEYIDIGVEVHLGGSSIAPGRRGTFEFECTMPDMVYQDTTDRNYASLQIKPTWFDPNLQTGSTNLRIAVHLPPGVEAEEVRYQNENTRYHDLVVFGEGDQQHVVAVWQYEGHWLSKNNPKVGVSFPKRDMEHVVRMTAIDLLVKWFSEHEDVRVCAGVVVVVMVGFLFFRFSHGTGWILFVILAAGAIWVMVNSPGCHLLLMLVILPALIALNEWYLRKGRRGRYLPAMATVEGAGIKRG